MSLEFHPAVENVCPCRASYVWCHQHHRKRGSTPRDVPQQCREQARTWHKGEIRMRRSSRDQKETRQPGWRQSGVEKEGKGRKKLREFGKGLKAKGGWCWVSGRRKGEEETKNKELKKKGMVKHSQHEDPLASFSVKRDAISLEILGKIPILGALHSDKWFIGFPSLQQNQLSLNIANCVLSILQMEEATGGGTVRKWLRFLTVRTD